ncbi:hypothetical protein AB1Y20_013980 [Prymnesium parvum]|uniref:Uncharacterized protein n=1 Tax=Prymnesium parvum TaxID=97485 RepID=A0AB34IGW2_PRYPA
MAGVAAGVKIRRDGESAGSLISGGATAAPTAPRHHAPDGRPLGGDSSANTRRQHSNAPLCVDATALRARAEPPHAALPREAVPRDPIRRPHRHEALADDYQAHVEDVAFAKLHATLARLERRAEREHAMYAGAAGWHRDERGDASHRRRMRSPSPLPAGRCNGERVAELLQQRAPPAARPRSTPPGRPVCASAPADASPRPRPQRQDSPRASPREPVAPRCFVPPLNLSRAASSRDLGRVRQESPGRRQFASVAQRPWSPQASRRP